MTKYPIGFEVKSSVRVGMNTLEQLIFNTYKQCYEIAPSEEIGSSQHAELYPVVVNGESNEYRQKNLIEWKNGNKNTNFILSEIMNDMCMNDIIPSGEYLIDVSW